jgi:RecG-like helicase
MKDNKLTKIPGVGPSIEKDLQNIDIKNINDLVDKDPEDLYEMSNIYASKTQDRCLLYVFRCAVYYANTNEKDRKEEKLKWWYWKDGR